MARRSGLGRGLDALIPTDQGISDTGSAVIHVEVSRVIPNPYQPRRNFDEGTLTALSASVREIGVVQPIIVREVDDGFELIAGERRWRAAQQAGLKTVPALIRPVDGMASLETAVAENLHRQDLNVLEEAAAYRQLMDDFGLTQNAVARRVSRSRSAVANTVRLLELPASVHKLIVAGLLSAGHARALLALDDPLEQRSLAAEIVRDHLSVRQVEQRVRGASAESGSARASRSASTPRLRTAGLVELEELLGSKLDTRVAVSLRKGRGKITIDFADLDDLQRIAQIINL